MGLQRKSAGQVVLFTLVVSMAPGVSFAAPGGDIGAGLSVKQKSARVKVILTKVKETLE